MFGELGIVFITSQTNKLEFVEVQLMKIKNPMLVVTDIDKQMVLKVAQPFYEDLNKQFANII